MLACIVPLAGPGFDLADGTTKAEIDVDGIPLVRRAIEGRSWWRRGELAAEAITFVLRDTAPSRLVAERLANWYPGSRHVFLSDFTDGAALSSLAGAAFASENGAPLMIDLVDILYRDDFHPAQVFANTGIGGAALVFPSTDPRYSYLETTADGNVVRAAEKRVIASNASAGTYVFADAATLLRAIAHALGDRPAQAYAGNLFVCPLMNGVISGGGRVVISHVDEVCDLKTTAAG